MGPLIDAELEAVDRRHAQLTRLSTELVDALNLYHQLMHENIQGGYGMPMPNGGKFISINHGLLNRWTDIFFFAPDIMGGCLLTLIMQRKLTQSL